MIAKPKCMHRVGIFFVLLCASLFYPIPDAKATSKDVKMVVTAAFVSEKGLPIYNELAKYLSRKLSRNVDLISGLTYEEADLMLRRGIIQVGFVCGLPYVQNVKQGIYSLVAMPVVKNAKHKFPNSIDYSKTPGKYYSYTIVRKGSEIKSWEDLKGKSYAYNEITSNSGYNMPRYKLIQLGVKSWEDYFSSIRVSGSHEESIRLVANGIVDASSVDSLVLDYDRSIEDINAKNVVIIETLKPGGAGVPPVVISSKADPALKTKLQSTLITMHQDPIGKRLLDKALLASFIRPNDHNYDDIREMENAAKRENFTDHHIPKLTSQTSILKK